MAGLNGAVPITATELRNWSQGTAKRLAAWQFQALLFTSRAYVNQLHTDSAIPPFGSSSDLSDPEILSKKMAKSLAGLCRPVGRKNK